MQTHLRMSYYAATCKLLLVTMMCFTYSTGLTTISVLGLALKSNLKGIICTQLLVPVTSAWLLDIRIYQLQNNYVTGF